MTARKLTLQILRRWDGGQVYAETLIEKATATNQLPGSERALLLNLVNTILRNRSLLNAWIGRMRKGKLNNDLRRILQIGLTQILLLDKAAHAAVNETVELAPNRGAAGVINAILRRAIREREKLQSFAAKLPPNSRYSHPLWLIERWNEAFGKEATRQLLKWNNQVPAKYLRRNPLVEGELPEQLTPLDDLPGYYRVEGGLPMEALDAGRFYVTDPSTHHAIELLDPKPGERVLDACAAPGGKAAHIAGRMQNQGELIATDSEEHRLPRLEENLARLGVSCAGVAVHDWTLPCPEKWRAGFDAILLDVPCSNTGVMQRRVDVRWRLTSGEFERITALQWQLLENSLPALKPGGRLVYSTCSIDPGENRQLIDRFLGEHSRLNLVGDHLQFPPEHATDGAYAARLELT